MVRFRGTTTPPAMTYARRYDLRSDRCAYNVNRTLHCSLKEAIDTAYNLKDEETGPINIMAETAAGHYCCVYSV